ncbi:hypothetical protein LZ32DRAFT_608638 [Colletotrichum eremochloae]|nr:hypothetical protein LZ32DRAFT_608638 [Colletotrichum eremochloae]
MYAQGQRHDEAYPTTNGSEGKVPSRCGVFFSSTRGVGERARASTTIIYAVTALLFSLTADRPFDMP